MEPEVEYYKLSLTPDRINFIDNRSEFLQFLTEIEANDESRIFGFDAEFFSAETCNDRVSIVQVATRSVLWQESWLK